MIQGWCRALLRGVSGREGSERSFVGGFARGGSGFGR